MTTRVVDFKWESSDGTQYDIWLDVSLVKLNYGADYDGNRGQTQWEITDIQLYDSNPYILEHDLEELLDNYDLHDIIWENIEYLQ